MTRAECLADRTTEPTLTDEQFSRVLMLVSAEVAAEKFVKRRRRRTRAARYKDLISDDMAGLTGADAAELLGWGD
jgi:hypothetical protein